MKSGKLLHRYWAKRLKALKKLFQVQINAIRDAVKVALKAMERRLKQMNEIRDQLKVQKDEFYTRNEGNTLDKKVDDLKEWTRTELDPLKKQKLLLDNKADRKAVNIAILIAAVGILVSLISMILNLRE